MLPAGATRSAPSICRFGSADPQTLQKLFTCRVPGIRNPVIRSRPHSQVIVAEDEKRLAAWADPVSFRQREQWHRKKLSKAPRISNRTAPHWQEPHVA
jgi:hypothetical protein